MSSMSIVSPVKRIALVAGLLLLGCGSSGGGGGNAAEFVGIWTFNSGSSIQPMCSGAGSTIGNQDLTGDMVTITEIDASHINVTSTNGINCNANFTVSGSTATVEPGQTCTVTLSGTVATVNITTWTATLTAGTIATSLTGTVNSVVTCTPSGSGTLSKSGGGTDASAD